jgi:hypothetical protein
VSFLRRLFPGSSRAEPAPEDDDSDGGADERPQVTAWVRLSNPDFENEREQQRVFELENRLIAVIEDAGAGTYDTNELARGAFGMRLLGPDPDRIVELIRPLLAEAPSGSYLTLRRGGPGTPEERIEIQPEPS